MAVVSVKSTAVTARDAKQIQIGNQAKGSIAEMVGYCAVTSGDSIGSKYIFGSIPSNARISSALMSALDIGTTTAADFGLYKTTANGGAVVDADFFKAAQALNAGPYDRINILNGNAQTLALSEKMVWEVLGLSADPCINYDVVATLTAAADGTAGIVLKVDYAI